MQIISCKVSQVNVFSIFRYYFLFSLSYIIYDHTSSAENLTCLNDVVLGVVASNLYERACAGSLLCEKLISATSQIRRVLDLKRPFYKLSTRRPDGFRFVGNPNHGLWVPK